MTPGKSLFGEPIDCISKDDIPPKLLKTYCWIHTTFSIESAWKKDLDSEIPYPGIDKYVPNEMRKYHAYYQWVCFVLFFQAMFFYIPRWFWKRVEGGRVAQLTKGIESSATRDKVRENIVKYLTGSLPFHNSLFFMYALLEVLNLLNVIIQMIIMDQFLGNEFSTYGLDVLKFTDWDWTVRYDPMLKVFPRMTKCTFRRFGSSGDVQKHDAMCVLPINIVNEKIYIFLWFWFYFVAIVSLIGLVYRLATLVSPRVRQLATYSRKRMSDVVSRDAFESIIKRRSCGTWFFLDLLSRNMDTKNFKQLVIDLDKSLEANDLAMIEYKPLQD